MIKYLFSFESLFVLWLFSYQYKNAFEIFTSPDITVLLTFILVPWGLVLYCKEKAKLKLNDPAVLAFLSFSLWLIISSFWSPSQTYKMEKTLCYVLYTIPGFLMAYAVIGKNPKRLKHLMSAIFIFSLLVLCETYRVFFVNGLSFITNVLNTNYLVTGQTLGAGLLVLLSHFYFRWSDKRAIDICGQALLSGLIFYALINLGGRGPVIAAGSAAVIFYGMQCWLNSSLKPGLQLGVLALFCSLLLFAFNGLFDHTGSHFYQRLAPLLSGQIDEAVNERLVYYQSAISVILEHPFIGVGLGGWPVSTGLGDISLHPHNIFLEVLSESGFIGFTLFITFLYFTFRGLKLRFLLSTPEQTSLALLTIFSLINAQKTGDLHDNLLMFVTLALCAALKKDSLDPQS